MTTHIPVHTTRNYHLGTLKVAVRHDHQSARFAFISSPQYFCADAEQLRQLADAMHDMADQIER